MRETGIYEQLGDVRYFIPHPMPPNPPLEMTHELTTLYGQASFALGRLNEMSARVPDVNRFIKGYVIKEALQSSAIEGVHTTLIDVFTASLEQVKPNKDTQLVINYTKALDAALDMLTNQGLPLVTRVILRAHEVLLSEGESEKHSPGAFRKQSVKVGELIPPPAGRIPQLMGSLEAYINEPSQTPSLIRAGLAHVQFETIHPFLDGNGRIGRLLIVLMLVQNGLLDLPLLYPSYYFKKHQFEYYQRLNRVRTHGDFEGWIAFYLMVIRDSAQDAYRRAVAIEELEQSLTERIQTDPVFAKTKETALLTLECLFSQPIIDASTLTQITGKAYNTAQNILKSFATHEILTERVIHKRKTLYRFEAYLALLEKAWE